MGACIGSQKSRYINYLPNKQPTNTAQINRQTIIKPIENVTSLTNHAQICPIAQEEDRNRSKGSTSTHETHSANESLLREVDRRKRPLRRQYYPLNSIGCLYFKNESKGSSIRREKEYHATGVIISKNLVLTCAHFLDQYRLVGNQNLKFLVASKDNQSFDQALQNSIEVDQFFICKNYRADRQSLQEDYGVVVLKESIIRDNFISLGNGFGLPQSQVSIYGYPYEGLKTSFDMKGMKGPIKQVRENIILYDIDTESGQSGSPILLEYAQNLYLVIGIHLGKHNDDDFNSGILITTSLIDEIVQWQKTLTDKSLSLQTGSTGCDTVSFKQKSNLKVINLNQVQLAWEKILTNEPLHQEKFENLLVQEEAFKMSKQLQNALEMYQLGKFHQSLRILQANIIGKNSKKKIAREQCISLYIQGLNYERLGQFQIAQAFYALCKKVLETIPKSNQRFIDECYTKVASIMSQTGRKQQGKMLLQYRRAETESFLYDHQKKLQAASALIQTREYEQAIEALESLKASEFQHSSALSQRKALIYHRLSAAYFAFKRYDAWVENISACLWIIETLQLESIPESSKWYTNFMRLAFDLRKSLDFEVKCKIGRAFTLLNKNLGFDMGYYCS